MLQMSLMISASRFLRTMSRWGRSPKVIGIHAGHDASIAIGVGGRVQCVLELERLFEERYFYLGGGSLADSDADYVQTWVLAVKMVLENCECDSGNCPEALITRWWTILSIVNLIC